MRIELEVNNLTKAKVPMEFLKACAEKTLRLCQEEFYAQKTVSLSCALVSPAEIARLNAIYRGKREVTDVLSFAEWKPTVLKKNTERKIFLGEIVLCPAYLKKAAFAEGTGFQHELAYIFSHGILHLLGWRHSRKMFGLQEKIALTITNKTKHE